MIHPHSLHYHIHGSWSVQCCKWRGVQQPYPWSDIPRFFIFLSATGKLVVLGPCAFGFLGSPNDISDWGYPPWKYHISPTLPVGTFGAGDFPSFPFGWVPCDCSPGGYLGTTHLWGQGIPQTRRPAGLDGDYPGATGPGIHSRERWKVHSLSNPFNLKWAGKKSWILYIWRFLLLKYSFFLSVSLQIDPRAMLIRMPRVCNIGLSEMCGIGWHSSRFKISYESDEGTWKVLGFSATCNGHDKTQTW